MCCLSTLALLLGLCLLTAIGLARRTPALTPSVARRALGFVLVAVPLPLALALHLLVRPAAALDQGAFVLGVVAFGVGAVLLLASEGGDERRDVTPDPDPAPWWPAFEREFGAYARESRRVRR